MRSQRGFVLLNALIIVAAMSAAVVVVLSRTETNRALQEIDQSNVQVRLYLDSYDAIALHLITEDLQYGSTDHPKDNWAQSRLNVEVDRGQVTGQIQDLQSKFNINWLVFADTFDSATAFREVAVRAALSPIIADAIIDFVRAGGADQTAQYTSQTIPVSPRPGPLASIWQLRKIPGMTDQEFTKLRKYAGVYGVEQPLNINTASRDVIESMIFGSSSGLGEILAAREQDPITSLEPFYALLEQNYADEKELAEAQAKFAIGSNTFLVQSAARLNDRQMRQETIIQRSGVPRRAAIVMTVGPL